MPLFWELTSENTQISIAFFGGTGWLRSSVAQGFNLPLYQLSYGSIWRKWWDSNSQAVARGGFLDRCVTNYATLPYWG